MNILMLASELAPLAGAGDLASEMAGLCGELKAQGHDVAVVLPYYRSVKEGKAIKAKKLSVKISVPLGSAKYSCDIFEGTTSTGVKVYLVGREEFYDRTGLYGSEGRDYQDNAARFFFLSKCALELAKKLDPKPDVVHAHGWQTAFASVFARDQKLPFRMIFTPHTLEYQGNFWSYDFSLTNLSGDYFSPRGVEYYGSMNCVKSGILFSDAVILPSEIAASAMQTARWGCGLEPVLREFQHKLYGIPTDLNSGHWEPAVDKQIAAPFSPKKPEARAKNTAPLLAALQLDPDPKDGVFVVHTPASGMEHLDAFIESLDRLLASDTRVAIFGPVDAKYDSPFQVAVRKHAGRVAYRPDADEALVRLAYAGTDFFVLPGTVEPSALWFMRSLKYGAVPVAFQCGGIAQFVQTFGEFANGFTYRAATADGLLDVLRRAVKTVGNGEIARLSAAAMSRDFSRAASARKHVELYESLLGVVAKAA